MKHSLFENMAYYLLCIKKIELCYHIHFFKCWHLKEVLFFVLLLFHYNFMEYIMTIFLDFFIPCDPLKPLDLLLNYNVDKPTIWLEICSRFGCAYPCQLRDYSEFAIKFKFLLWKRIPTTGLKLQIFWSPSQCEDH